MTARTSHLANVIGRPIQGWSPNKADVLSRLEKFPTLVDSAIVAFSPLQTCKNYPTAIQGLIADSQSVSSTKIGVGLDS
jgi:hypothetical protein